MIIILQPPFLFSEREVIMDEKQNIDTPNGFSKKIGRTHFLVNFAFKKDATERTRQRS